MWYTRTFDNLRLSYPRYDRNTVYFFRIISILIIQYVCLYLECKLSKVQSEPTWSLLSNTNGQNKRTCGEIIFYKLCKSSFLRACVIYVIIDMFQVLKVTYSLRL